MRKLVVASQEELSPSTVAYLTGNSWALTYASSAAVARTLETDPDFMVGLAVFPESREEVVQLRVQQTVYALPRVKWIGALARGDMSDNVVKRFITERLYDFQVFPLDGERLTMALGHAYGMATVEREFRRTEEESWSVRSGLIGESPVMQKFYRVLRHAAESDVPVLIMGPTGTGKERAARAIHDHSSRARGPFVPLNCAAIPPSLLQAELFGHSKGAFTDASERKSGLIEAAEGGTLFLDEIGDMPMESQATLLRFLEDKLVTPLGSNKSVHVDVRAMASTNKDLESAIRDGAFRADLFYRLAVLIVRSPSLSLRGSDIELLANFFLDEAIAAVGTPQDLHFGEDALKLLRAHSWPGNLRELRSCVFQAAIHCQGRRKITPTDLNFVERSKKRDPSGSGKSSLRETRDQSEKKKIEAALSANESNITKTAKALNISRMTLYRLMAKHDIGRGGGS